MLDLRTGKEMTRGGFLKGILASGIAPAITLGTLAKVESANASVGRGMMRNVGARNAAVFGGDKGIDFQGKTWLELLIPTQSTVNIRVAGITTIEWGDGSIETTSSSSLTTYSHQYNAGLFMLKIGRDATRIDYSGPNSDTIRNYAKRLLAWSDGITNSYNAFAWCRGLTEIPNSWNNITSTEITYWDCKFTSITPWGNLVKASGTYRSCNNLTEVPEWGSELVSVQSCFEDCIGLVGNIPRWGSKTNSASWTFKRCTGLTGAWTSDPDELMPSRITSHDSTVEGCSSSLRSLFRSDWGGTI